MPPFAAKAEAILLLLLILRTVLLAGLLLVLQLLLTPFAIALAKVSGLVWRGHIVQGQPRLALHVDVVEVLCLQQLEDVQLLYGHASLAPRRQIVEMGHAAAATHSRRRRSAEPAGNDGLGLLGEDVEPRPHRCDDLLRALRVPLLVAGEGLEEAALRQRLHGLGQAHRNAHDLRLLGLLSDGQLHLVMLLLRPSRRGGGRRNRRGNGRRARQGLRMRRGTAPLRGDAAATAAAAGAARHCPRGAAR
mmetsp:Transcript_62371/g.203497  ORF Transcript_62371/g.203497 Transcript_62371/m.203497 type:complete len:247 (+) Transcript_62371:531-1271(+)